MFVVVEKRFFWWPVTVRVPDPDKVGGYLEGSFEALFEALPIDRARAMDAARNALPPAEQEAQRYDFLHAIVHDWRDVVDAERRPIPFSREAFTSFLQIVFQRDGLLAAYTEAMSGQAARLGNFVAQPAH